MTQLSDSKVTTELECILKIKCVAEVTDDGDATELLQNNDCYLIGLRENPSDEGSAFSYCIGSRISKEEQTGLHATYFAR